MLSFSDNSYSYLYIMLLLLVVLNTFVGWCFASESTQDTSANNHLEKRIKTNQGALSFYASLNNNAPMVNRTYFEKDENLVRVPNKFYEERKKKNKIKKLPKRTIQKIIKNGKSKSRKIYVHPVTRLPTITSENVDIVDSNTQRNEEVLTQRSHKIRLRKKSKVIRYPMPFHRFQTRRELSGRKRSRRDVDRNDIYILKDLDEIEFLSKEKDYDIVRAHVQNYW